MSKLFFLLCLLTTAIASGHDNDGHDHEGHETEPKIPGPFIFPFICLGIGIVFDALFSQSMATVFLLGISFGLTFLAVQCLGTIVVDYFLQRWTWQPLNPYYVMFALLPTLIFDSAFSLDAHHFKRYAYQLLTFAGPAFIVAFVTMGCMMHVMMYAAGDYSWTILYCLLYGAIVSATDPVAVVALLKALGVPHHLKVLIEGESLFNDGAAIFFHSLLHIILGANTPDLKHPHGNPWVEIGWRFAAVIFSVIIGYVYAQVTATLLGNLYDSVRERAVVVIFVYASYVTAEWFNGSGVLCLVIYGISLNAQRQWMSSESYIDNKRMWGFLAYFANCIIFIMTGILAGRDVAMIITQEGSFTSWHYLYGFLAYIFTILSRAAPVMIFAVLVVRRFGHYPPEFSPVLIWGGLRGSLALLLALQSNNDPVFEQMSKNAGQESDHIYKTTLVYISITVVLSNLIQGITCGPLTRKLGLCGMSELQLDHVKAVTHRLNEQIELMIETKKADSKYANVNWKYVEKRVKLDAHTGKEDMAAAAETEEEEARECVQRCYEAQLWNLWNTGYLSVDVRALQNAINEAATSHGPLNVEHLYEHLKSSKIRKWLGLFCIKYGGFFDATKCGWFADKPHLIDAWHLIAATIACFQAGFSIYLFVCLKTAIGASKIYMFANCMILLFLACEPIFRLWSERANLRKIFLKKFIIWPWIDALSVAVYGILVATYIVAFKECQLKEYPSGKNSPPSEYLVATDDKGVCKALRTVILFGVVSFIKFPQVIFLLCRFVIHVAIAGALQRKDEEALEGLNALITMTQAVKQRLDDGTLIDDPVLRKKLSDECKVVKTDAEKKVTALMKKGAGLPLMTTIRTRQVCRELLHAAQVELKKLEDDGDLGEAEHERLLHTIDICRRNVQGLHKLTPKNLHKEKDDSDRSLMSKKKGASRKKKV